MSRAKRGFKLRRKHNKLLKMTKGYRGSRSNLYRIASQIFKRGLVYAFRDRRAKKRDFRSLWICRINAASRNFGLSYSKFMMGLSKLEIKIDRKMLSKLAIEDNIAFKALADKVKNIV